jgi:excisionase family DNA binding protein
VLRVKDVAKRLSCSLSTVYQLIECGALPSHRVGMRQGIRVSEDDLNEYVSRRRNVAESQPIVEAKRNGVQFKHLDGERLRAAWRQQGVQFAPTDASNAPSSGS